MNVHPSKDLYEIAGLYATGEIESYTKYVAGAAAAAEELENWRDNALAVGAELLESSELAYTAAAKKLPVWARPYLKDSPVAYAGLSGPTLETAAGEFLALANYATENDDCIQDSTAPEEPGAVGYAALYLAGETTRYELARTEIVDCIQELRGIAAAATAAAENACWVGYGDYPTGGQAEVLAATAYSGLAAQITAAVGGYVVTLPENLQ